MNKNYCQSFCVTCIESGSPWKNGCCAIKLNLLRRVKRGLPTLNCQPLLVLVQSNPIWALDFMSDVLSLPPLDKRGWGMVVWILQIRKFLPVWLRIYNVERSHDSMGGLLPAWHRKQTVAVKCFTFEQPVGQGKLDECHTARYLTRWSVW